MVIICVDTERDGNRWVEAAKRSRTATTAETAGGWTTANSDNS